eukprot:5083239-Amphidinium_carterae.2
MQKSKWVEIMVLKVCTATFICQGDMRTHLAVIDAFLTTHTSEVVVVMFQMFDSFVDSTCEELFQEELQKSFTGTGFLTRDDTASGWPTIEVQNQGN